MHGHAHLREWPHVSHKPVGGDDRAPEGASGEAGSACADARLAEAHLLEEHIPMRVHAGHDAHLVPACATPDPVATAAPGRDGAWKTLAAPVVARQGVRDEGLVHLGRASRSGLERWEHPLHHLEDPVTHEEARLGGRAAPCCRVTQGETCVQSIGSPNSRIPEFRYKSS